MTPDDDVKEVTKKPEKLVELLEDAADLLDKKKGAREKTYKSLAAQIRAIIDRLKTL